MLVHFNIFQKALGISFLLVQTKSSHLVAERNIFIIYKVSAGQKSGHNFSWVLCFRVSLGGNPGVNWGCSLIGVRLFPLPLVVDRIHILAASGLKILVSCWKLSLVPEDYLQFLATWATFNLAIYLMDSYFFKVSK